MFQSVQKTSTSTQQIDKEKMKTFMSHESYYSCECGSEVLLLRTYNDEQIVEFAVCGNFPRIKSWKEQLRWIWHIICNKEVWSDQILLDKDTARRLGEAITNLTKEP